MRSYIKIILLLFSSIIKELSWFFVQVYFRKLVLRACYTVLLVTLLSGIRPLESVGIEPELSV